MPITDSSSVPSTVDSREIAILRRHIAIQKNRNDESAWDNFAFDEYFKTTTFSDIPLLTQHGRLITQEGMDPQLFYLQAATAFLKQYPVRANNLLPKSKIGDAYINPGDLPGTAVEEREVLQAIGYFVLNQVAKEIEQQHWSAEMIAGDVQKNDIYNLLKRNKVHVALKPPSNLSKCIGDPSRCARRLSDMFSRQLDRFTGHTQGKPITSTRLSSPQLLVGNLYALKRDRTELGHALAVPRGAIQVGYLATRQRGRLVSVVQERARSIGLRMLAIAAGGFSTAAGAPEGLTFQNGRPINAALGPKHGLVIIDADGAIRVADLKDGFNLPGIPQSLMPSVRLIDYYRLCGWLKRNRASAFQTYLLAHGNKFLLNEDKVPSTSTERRFFAAVRDKNSGELLVVLINIFKANDMYNAAHDAFQFLTEIDGNSKKIEFLVYLDVGAYDILQVLDRNQRQVPQLVGKKDPNTATNLIYLLAR